MKSALNFNLTSLTLRLPINSQNNFAFVYKIILLKGVIFFFLNLISSVPKVELNSLLEFLLGRG